eukprot:5767232-Pleurochrysis_carterae.AAC.1
MVGREATVGQVLLPRVLEWQRDRVAIRSLHRRLLFIRTWVCVSRSRRALNHDRYPCQWLPIP